MASLAETYHYTEKNIHVPEQNHLDEAGKMNIIGRVIFPSGLVINGTSIDYDVMTYKTPRFLYVMLTAIDSNSSLPVGFRDVRINDGMVSYGDGCFGQRGEELPRELWRTIPDCSRGVPYRSIRFNEESDGGTHSFVVKEPFQGKGLGKSMLFTVFEIEQRLGFVMHVINTAYDGTVKSDEQGNESSYYQHMGARNHHDMYHIFQLNEEKSP